MLLFNSGLLKLIFAAFLKLFLVYICSFSIVIWGVLTQKKPFAGKIDGSWFALDFLMPFLQWYARFPPHQPHKTSDINNSCLLNSYSPVQQAYVNSQIPSTISGSPLSSILKAEPILPWDALVCTFLILLEFAVLFQISVWPAQTSDVHGQPGRCRAKPTGRQAYCFQEELLCRVVLEFICRLQVQIKK